MNLEPAGLLVRAESRLSHQGGSFEIDVLVTGLRRSSAGELDGYGEKFWDWCLFA